VPAFALRLALGELSTVLVDGQRAVPSSLQDLGFAFRFPQLEAALENLLD
jgi:NAD dependent epimerase/dehydratase family enzyme